MQLNKKKELAARTLKVGKGRIVFNKQRLDEIKDVITKQDIRDLLKDRAIVLTEIKGSKKKVKRKTRRRAGSIKKKVKKRKELYMILTRKLRSFVSVLREKGIITSEEYWQLRKEIRVKKFRSKAHLKEIVSHMVKERKEGD